MTTRRHPLRAATIALALGLGGLAGACGDDGDKGVQQDATTTTDATNATGDTANDTSGMPDLSGGDGVVTTDRVTIEELAGGITATTVDASDADAWVYVDLAGKRQVSPEDPADDASWDLAFQRFRIATNGGISGTGDVAVAILDGADFDALTEAPADATWLTDAADGDDEDTDADLGFLVDGAWYAYDPVNHTLAPRTDRVYVLRDRAGDHFKLRVVDYYDDAGNAGEVTFHWVAIDPPPVEVPADQFVVEAPSGEHAFVDADARATVTPSNPEASTDWDFAVIGAGIATNSGTSGIGLAGARLGEGAYDAITATDTVGFAVDAVIPLPGPPGSGTYSGNPVLADWFDYNSSTHQVSPKDQRFIIRLADGSYAKLMIVAQVSADWTFRVAPIARAPEVHTLSLTAPAGGDPVYVSLRQGGTVEIDDAAASDAWDVAFAYLTVRTNGGTSGAGEGAAVALADTPFTSVAEVAAEVTWVEDAMIPVPGPPGSGEVSGNGALGAWYDYDSTNHTVSATADKTFLVRAADGSYAKLAIVASDGTDYEIQWVYAGPNETTFGGTE